MNKQVLISEVAKQTGLTKKDSTAVVDAVVSSIMGALAQGKEVHLTGFGKFMVVDRAARTGRNPQTGEAIRIPATKTPAFRAGKELKEAVKS